jgi:hypothetical protein
MYTGEGDTTRLEHGRDSGMDPNMLGTLLVRLSPDLSLVDIVTPVGSHKMHIFTANIPIFHSRYRR